MAASVAVLAVLLFFATLAIGDQGEPIVSEGIENHYVRSHSLHPPYLDADLSNRFWDFGGSTVVNTNEYIRLTPDEHSKSGWLWSKEPFEHDNWVIEFDFRIGGEGTTLYGDGFAFWFTRQRAEHGPAFGSRDIFDGLGIFFDTYPNSFHDYTFPYVSAMVNKGGVAYSVNDDNAANSIAGCEATFRKLYFPTRARVKYYLGTVTVSLDIRGRNEFQECFHIENVHLKGPYYVGFSAMTGGVKDTHDILHVTSTQLVPPQEDHQQYLRSVIAKQAGVASAPSGESKVVQQQTGGDSSGFGFYSVLAVVAVGLLIVGGIFLNNLREKQKNKRF